QGRQPPRGGARLDRRGVAGGADPGPDAGRRGGPGAASRDPERPGAPDPGTRHAASRVGGAGRSLRDAGGRDTAWPGCKDAGARARPRASLAGARDIREKDGPRMTDNKTKPLYMIGVVGEMLKLHPQTLRMYEKRGLIRPSRTEGKTRMYSAEDVEEIARLVRLTRDLGVNLAVVEIILKMRRRMLDMQAQMEQLLGYVRDDVAQKPDSPSRGTGEALVRAASGQLSPVEMFWEKGQHNHGEPGREQGVPGWRRARRRWRDRARGAVDSAASRYRAVPAGDSSPGGGPRSVRAPDRGRGPYRSPHWPCRPARSLPRGSAGVGPLPGGNGGDHSQDGE